MKYHITKLNSKPATRKDGTFVLTRNGSQMYKVGIQTAEHGDKWLNGLLPFNPDRWEGSEQELVVEVDPKWGLQFELPPREKAPEQTKPTEGLGEIKLSILNIHRKLDQIINHLSGENRLDRTSDGTPLPSFDTKEVEQLEQLAKEHA